MLRELDSFLSSNYFFFFFFFFLLNIHTPVLFLSGYCFWLRSSVGVWPVSHSVIACLDSRYARPVLARDLFPSNQVTFQLPSFLIFSPDVPTFTWPARGVELCPRPRGAEVSSIGSKGYHPHSHLTRQWTLAKLTVQIFSFTGDSVIVAAIISVDTILCVKPCFWSYKKCKVTNIVIAFFLFLTRLFSSLQSPLSPLFLNFLRILPNEVNTYSLLP